MPEPAAATPCAPLTILLVDDDPMVREVTAMMLSDAGHTVLEAGNGAEALLLLERHAPVQLLITDINMPGMDGLELGQRVRQLYPELPVVLTSGYSEVLARDNEHGFELLHKPHSIEQLSRVLRRVGRGRRGSAEGH